jgi:hypothetical protein
VTLGAFATKLTVFPFCGGGSTVSYTLRSGADVPTDTTVPQFAAALTDPAFAR